jgi:glycosyltransferase involved in cell wall biosynthesis
MLQAGMCRKPFIGAKVDGIGELIENGVNGLLFTSGNEKELAEKILIFKNDADLASKCAENLHKDIMSNYTQITIIPKIEKLYKDVINS